MKNQVTFSECDRKENEILGDEGGRRKEEGKVNQIKVKKETMRDK